MEYNRTGEGADRDWRWAYWVWEKAGSMELDYCSVFYSLPVLDPPPPEKQQCRLVLSI